MKASATPRSLSIFAVNAPPVILTPLTFDGGVDTLVLAEFWGGVHFFSGLLAGVHFFTGLLAGVFPADGGLEKGEELALDGDGFEKAEPVVSLPTGFGGEAEESLPPLPLSGHECFSLPTIVL